MKTSIPLRLLLITLFLAFLAGSAGYWLPQILRFAHEQSAEIQLIESSVQILLWVAFIVASLIGLRKYIGNKKEDSGASIEDAKSHSGQIAAHDRTGGGATIKRAEAHGDIIAISGSREDASVPKVSPPQP